MNTIKNASIYCGEKFINIYTEAIVGSFLRDPLGEDIYLGLDADLYSIGDAVIKALDKSRDLSISAEDLAELNRLDFQDVSKDREWVYERYPERKLFDRALVEERSEKWVNSLCKLHKYKTKSALFRTIQSVNIERTKDNIKFTSNDHDRYNGFTPLKSIAFNIPSSSSVEVVGAAAKYAIGNCRGKGADLIREILFPEGQPSTFDEYLKELELSV